MHICNKISTYDLMKQKPQQVTLVPSMTGTENGKDQKIKKESIA